MRTPLTYSWHPDANVRIDAEWFAAECERIEAVVGVVRPEDLADAAADPGHGAHAYIYDKTGEDAARAYHVSRAAELLRWIRIETTPGKTYRARVRVNDGSAYRYATLEEAGRDVEFRERHRQHIIRRLRALRAELATFDEYAALCDAISDALDEAAA